MRGAIEWMAENHVAANLAMALVIVLGAFSLLNLNQEIFPEVETDFVTVQVEYRGASPEEVEEAIVIKIEEAIAGVDGIDNLTSNANEGMGTVNAEVKFGEDVSEVRDRIRREVDRITSFPDNAEKPVVFDSVSRHSVIQLGIYGQVDSRTLKSLADRMKNDLTSMNGISLVDLTGVKNFEISIEVSEEKLKEYGITFDLISRAVTRESLDLPGGTIKSEGGEILVRTKALGKVKADYEKIVLLSDFNGHTVRVEDVATVIDGFEDTDLFTYFDGKPAALINVFRVGNEGAIDVAEKVYGYIEKVKEELPEGVSIIPWHDMTKILRSRIDLLVRNAVLGFILVVISLTLFLEIGLALWVSSGIVISFMGGFLIMNLYGYSINLFSLFAFILVLGIVVDDAIVVGENIFSERESGLKPLAASRRGVKGVFVPVIFAVLTTVAAFLPLLRVEGFMGKIIVQLPIIIIGVLSFSLLESIFILPAHLSLIGEKAKNPVTRFSAKVSGWFDNRLKNFVENKFEPFLERSLKNRYIVIATGIAMLLIVGGMVSGGVIKFNFMPDVEGDTMTVLLKMPTGTPVDKTRKIIEHIERQSEKVKVEFEEKFPEYKDRLFLHRYAIIGQQPSLRFGPMGGGAVRTDSSKAEITIELLSSEERNVSTMKMIERWRELVGEIPGADSLEYKGTMITAGNAVQLEFSDPDPEILEAAIGEVKKKLATFDGVYDIRDDAIDGKMELKIRLKDEARTLGLTEADLARQVRQGFYGDESLRIQRGRDEVKVMVRYLEKERRKLSDIENMMIRTPAGGEIPFSVVANVELGRGYATITRSNRLRVIQVMAKVDETVTSGDDVNRALKSLIDKDLKTKYRHLTYREQGKAKERKKGLKSLGTGFMVILFVIYMLLAIPFKSYSQPLVIMSAIPFGIVGATLAHMMLGWPLTMMSLMGIVALSGVVVNDSLVLVDLANQLHREKGETFFNAVLQASRLRFRPIMLTSVTTFLGLLPMIFERSIQAKILIPMAISLGFGVVFATAITLVLIPSGILMIEDLKNGGKI